MKYSKEYWDWNNSQDDLLIKQNNIMKSLFDTFWKETNP